MIPTKTLGLTSCHILFSCGCSSSSPMKKEPPTNIRPEVAQNLDENLECNQNDQSGNCAPVQEGISEDQVDFLRFKFNAEDISTDRGEYFSEGWGLKRSNRYRGACFATTPKIDLGSSGFFSVSFVHKTSWHGELASINDAWEIDLFSIKIRYLDESGQPVLIKEYVSLNDLDFQRRLRDHHSPEDHYRFETGGLTQLKLDRDFLVKEGASNIEISICNVSPGTRPIINKITIDTYILIDEY